ncbi:Tn3 family transposase [Cysteiniphilum sp. 6C5]|uniref:Tn3 family transposase n=1 Tax=unclassified Cysteiniphilum TaxID=2610889 RepID=UPI003F878B8A
MSTIERTAYPRYSNRRRMKPSELDEFYTLSSSEVSLMNRYARGDKYRLNFAIQLKTFQNLGYFIALDEVPDEIINHIRKTTNFHYRQSYGYERFEDDYSKSLYTHRDRIRIYLNVTKWDKQEVDGCRKNLARKAAIKYAYEISHTMNNIPDIINAVIQYMIENRLELPGFHTLDDLVRHTRHTVNNKIFQQVFNRIELDGKQEKFVSLLHNDNNSYSTLFNDLKTLPQKPSKRNFNNFIKHYNWLSSLGDGFTYLKDVAQIKIEQFAEDANKLSADEIKKMRIAKQYTYICSLIYLSQANARDALASMLCRLVSTGYKQAKQELERLAQANKKDSCEVAELLKNIVKRSEFKSDFDNYSHWVVGQINNAGGVEEISKKCDDVITSHGTEIRIFLSKVLLHRQQSLFHRLIETISPKSSNSNDSLIQAIQFIQDNQKCSREYFNQIIDLSFTVDFWRSRIMTKVDGVQQMNRKELITCVLDALSKGLNSGDIHVEGAINYGDYRSDFLPWDKCLEYLDDYCKEVGIDSTAQAMVCNLQKSFIEKAKEVDDNYKINPAFTIDSKGVPSLKKYEAKPLSESAKKLENILKSRMPERSVLDCLSNAEYHVSWTSECTSPEGNDLKLDNPKEKLILSAFAVGTGLGATQTAKHVRGNVSARILSRVNQKHFSVKVLNKAITRVINCLNQFPLLQAWGTGESCAVDGTLEEIHDNNMLAEQHIRYGKKGGIAYHHVADNYIALFSTFIQCGVWEAIHIIDGLLKNASEVQPKTVHADTQGQSLPVFAFSYLFGIKLMPRIRSWKELKMYRPTKGARYKNIDSLFCEAAIDWDLITLHWKDLMQVVLSIKYGKISSSFILAKLNSYNYRNKLYVSASNKMTLSQNYFANQPTLFCK